MKNKNIKPQLVLYTDNKGNIEFQADIFNETIWATQAQIANAFDVNVRTINEHIQGILKTKELSRNTTIRNFRIVQNEGKRDIEREIKHYNLDMILSVGYRVNSKKATTFRKWATKTLRSYITDGFAINRERIRGGGGMFIIFCLFVIFIL